VGDGGHLQGRILRPRQVTSPWPGDLPGLEGRFFLTGLRARSRPSRPNRTVACRVPNSCPILRATAVTHGYSGSAFSFACNGTASPGASPVSPSKLVISPLVTLHPHVERCQDGSRPVCGARPLLGGCDYKPFRAATSRRGHWFEPHYRPQMSPLVGRQLQLKSPCRPAHTLTSGSLAGSQTDSRGMPWDYSDRLLAGFAREALPQSSPGWIRPDS
jgi:hypothetical protein